MNNTKYDDDLLNVINKEIPELKDNSSNYSYEWKTKDVIESVFTEIKSLLQKYNNIKNDLSEYINNGQEMSSESETFNLTAPSLEMEDNVKVNTTSLRLRSGAGTKYDTKEYLGNGTELKIIGEEKDGWIEVETPDGKTGYVATKYLDKTIQKQSSSNNSNVKVNTTSLRLRSGAGTKYDTIEYLGNGTKLKIIGEEKDGWIAVETPDGKTGYVATKYLDGVGMKSSKQSSPTSTLITPNNYKQYKKSVEAAVLTKGSNLNLRIGPGTDNAKITSIPNNSKIEVLGESGNWSRVKFDDYEGWVSTNYLKK